MMVNENYTTITLFLFLLLLIMVIFILGYDNLLLFWQTSEVMKSYNNNGNNNSLQAPNLVITTFLQALVNGPSERTFSCCNLSIFNNIPCSSWFLVSIFATDNDDNGRLICSAFSSLLDQWWNMDKHGAANLMATTTMTPLLATIDCIGQVPQTPTPCTANRLYKQL